MKYKKHEDPGLDRAYQSAKTFGMKIKLGDEVLFYRRFLHWEYLLRGDTAKVHRKIEEVISYCSCCAEHMDIQKLVVTKKSGEVLEIHVCDGTPEIAESLYEALKCSWMEVEFGKKQR